MRRQLVAIVALAVGCGDNTKLPAPGSCDADPDPRCANPIDHVMVPMLRALDVPLVDAPLDELCRRVYIDLVDRGPTVDEREACLRDRFEDTVDRLLADPLHERAWRARWSKLLGYNLYATGTADIVDLDDRIGAMDRGDISYRDFASAVVWHPAFWALNNGDNWAMGLFSAFLGRPARDDEVAGLRPITRFWLQRIYDEGFYWFFLHQQALASGSDEATATAIANVHASDGAKADWGIDVCGCGGGEGIDPCETDTLGEPVSIAPRCSATGANVARTRDYTPGQTDECPDGTHRPECADRLTDFAGNYTPITDWPDLDDATRNDLDGIGRALAARHDFWDAAADRELRWLLGWWQSTFVQADSDLPDVRQVLADLLKVGASPRDIDRMIVTSLLYRLPASPPPVLVDPDSLPPWTMGPTKLLSGEGWLRAAVTAVGETVAPCDHRFVVRGAWNAAYVDPRRVDHEASSISTVVDPIKASMALGGCNGDTMRPVISNLQLTYEWSQLARPLCAYGSGVVVTGNLGAAVDHLGVAILGRHIIGDERTALVGEMHACLAQGDVGCIDDDSSVRWMCRRMIDSVEFGTY